MFSRKKADGVRSEIRRAYLNYSCLGEKNDRIKNDGLIKSQLNRHPGKSRGPEGIEITGFRPSPE